MRGERRPRHCLAHVMGIAALNPSYGLQSTVMVRPSGALNAAMPISCSAVPSVPILL